MSIEPRHFDFCPILQDLLVKGEFVGASGQLRDDVAFSTNNNLITLRNLHLAFKPQRTLEIGLCYGGSCLVMTATHRELGQAPSRQHTAIDPFQTQKYDDVGLLITRAAGLEGYLDFHPRFSCEVLPELIKAGAQYDLVYIDGSHLFEDVFIDLYYVIRLLSPGGIVALDDSTYPHVAKVIKFVKTNLRDILVPLDLSAYRMDQGKSVSYRLAKWLGKAQLTGFRKTGKCERELDAPFVNF